MFVVCVFKFKISNFEFLSDHGGYSLVVKLRFVEPVSRVRFSLATHAKKTAVAVFFLG